jgi:hypothetical protein
MTVHAYTNEKSLIRSYIFINLKIISSDGSTQNFLQGWEGAMKIYLTKLFNSLKYCLSVYKDERLYVCLSFTYRSM